MFRNRSQRFDLGNLGSWKGRFLAMQCVKINQNVLIRAIWIVEGKSPSCTTCRNQSDRCFDFGQSGLWKGRYLAVQRVEINQSVSTREGWTVEGTRAEVQRLLSHKSTRCCHKSSPPVGFISIFCHCVQHPHLSKYPTWPRQPLHPPKQRL